MVAKVVGEISLGDVPRRLGPGFRKGMVKATEHLLGVARQLVPHERGDLERSGKAMVSDDGRRGAVSFGTPYSVYQHETEGLQHDPGRQDHYLSQPMDTEREVMLGLIAAELRREMKRQLK